MKRKLLLISFLVIITSTFSQTYIPDDNFEQALIDYGYDDVLDDNVVTANISSIIDLDLNYKNINSLQGIENFVGLETLNVEGNSLTSLNVSSLINLINLNCKINNISELILGSNLSKLEILSCTNNLIDNLNLPELTSLKQLDCYSNKIIALDLSLSNNLEYLDCSYNLLTTLDISNLLKLTSLSCFENSIENLILSNDLTALTSLYCNANSISNLDLNGLTSLQSLSCSYNQISTLDFSTLTSLEILSCSYNQFDSLDLSNSPVTRLDCSFNEPLNVIYIKNGVDIVFSNTLPFPGEVITNFNSCPNLQFICVDEGAEQTSIQDQMDFLGYDTYVSTDCSQVYNPDLFPSSLFTIVLCDDDFDGFVSFDLTNVESEIKSYFPTNSNLSFTYHLTLDDAMSSSNPIITPNTYISSGELIYIHVLNLDTSEFSIAQIQLEVYPIPNIGDYTLEGCDSFDGLEDGFATFNLNSLVTTIQQNIQSADVTFYLETERITEISDLNYTNTVRDAQLIYGRVTSFNECFNDFEIQLNVLPTSAEIVCIPDYSLKNGLVNTLCVDTDNDGIADTDADINNDNQIQTSEAEAVQRLIFSSSFTVFDLTGIESFINLIKLNFENINFSSYDFNQNQNNGITNLDFSTLIRLEYLELNNIESFHFENINLSGLTNLLELKLTNFRPYDTTLHGDPNSFITLDLTDCTSLEKLGYTNSFFIIDFCQIPLLKELDCHYLEGGEPKIFDFSCLSKLEILDISENIIDILILKNSSTLTSINYFDIDGGNYPYPNYICTDDIELEINQITEWVGNNTTVNTYCSFSPGGVYYSITGTNRVDSNNDGCDVNDFLFPNLKLHVTDGNIEGEFISSTSGSYDIPLPEGTHTVTPILENPDYFSISPTSMNIEFPTDSSPFIQDFCITPIPGINDLEISVIPTTTARPGFDATYKIIYKNKASTTLSGNVIFNFSDEIMDVVSSEPIIDTQESGSLTWNYSDILPFESREIIITLNVNSPVETPAVNNGDVLTLSATINPVSGDKSQEDNLFTLNQTVVGSYDPNDKRCLEGNIITQDLVGEYVHYLIRCENTGTAEAVNIVIKDVIDPFKFDISTLIITDSSHEMVTKIDGNTVEFIFENINLPFDDANNDGYVAFKIKTLPTLIVGDSFENDAEIYFDFNPAIETNMAQTSVSNTLGLNDYYNLIEDVLLYPNPTTGFVNITSNLSFDKIEVYTNLGQLITSFSGKNKINISNLSQGIYFVKIIDQENNFTVKRIIKD